MDTGTEKVIFALLRSAVCGGLLSDEEKELYDARQLPQLLHTARRHDVAHLLALGLKKNDLLDENDRQIETEIFRAVYRYEQLNYELNALCAALEAAQIPFLPLKGAVIRSIYLEPWMRTSCDIDILVHEADLQKTIAYLTEHCAYRFEVKNSHDASMYTPGGNHIELHYGLIEQGKAQLAAAVLNEVWNTAVRCSGSEYRYEMPDEMFYFYHVAHMAKHFENGGCGIRPFIDLWMLNHRTPFNQNQRSALLEKGRLAVFAKQAERLAETWFGEEEYTEITKQMANYILRGGVYGTDENRIAVQQQKEGGQIKYALSKIFIPYSELRFHYPVLEQHPYLTPLMEVRRWGKLIFCGQLKRTTKELKYNSSIPKEAAEEMRLFLKNIGLQ